MKSVTRACAIGLASVTTFAAVSTGLGAGASSALVFAAIEDDVIYFKSDGSSVRGTILGETEDEVRFLLKVGGISGEVTYKKVDILKIQRGDAPAPETGAAELAPSEEPKSDDAAGDAGAPGVYVVELKGEFGRDIAVSPLRDIVKDAARHKPEYIILVCDNAWEFQGEELPNDAAAFDQLFLTESLEPIFTKELPDIFGYEPKIVVWVKSAMGGMCFLPFNFSTVYFASDGRMGGIGNLAEMFGSTGDEMVREKQFSLRLGHARGMANTGGYETKLIEAMARTDYVLSYRIENGRAIFEERMPKPELGEVLLTDDGQGDNEDNIQDLARGKGNDTLTLNAAVAKDVGVSRGTVDDMDALLYELEIDRRHRMIEGKSARILEGWTREVKDGERALKRLWQEFGEVQVQGERPQRLQARATQMRKIKEIIGLLERFEELVKIGMFDTSGVPDIPTLNVMHETIRQEQMKDRP